MQTSEVIEYYAFAFYPSFKNGLFYKIYHGSEFSALIKIHIQLSLLNS